MRVTEHAKGRMKERMGLPKKSLDKVAQKAIERGITHAQATGQLKKYMDGVFLSHNNASEMRIYNQKMFVFTSDFTLITVFKVPTSLLPAVNKVSKRMKE